MAMLTLIDIMASATIRQSESEPIASEAATACISREEATGAAGPSNPAAPRDRVMVGFLNPRANHPAQPGIPSNRRQDLGGKPWNVTE
jgi:hypothetical protein